MNLLLFLITFLVVAGSAALALYGVVADRPGQALWAGTAAAAWSAVYLVVLLAVSLASHEKVLGWHQFKRFCGLYLDCHAMVSVLNVETARSLGEGERQVEADGVFYIVTVRQGSDAKRVLIAVDHPVAVVIDEDGRRYHRSARGERALARGEGPLPALGRAVEAGDAYTTKLIFELPEDVRAPRLNIVEGHWLTRLSEFFLIGDEDSFLHKPTTFRLTT